MLFLLFILHFIITVIIIEHQELNSQSDRFYILDKWILFHFQQIHEKSISAEMSFRPIKITRSISRSIEAVIFFSFFFHNDIVDTLFPVDQGNSICTIFCGRNARTNASRVRFAIIRLFVANRSDLTESRVRAASRAGRWRSRGLRKVELRRLLKNSFLVRHRSYTTIGNFLIYSCARTPHFYLSRRTKDMCQEKGKKNHGGGNCPHLRGDGYEFFAVARAVDCTFN